MSTSAVVGDTPYYVLMDGNCRIGPRMVWLRTETECLAIYGFADKGPYDRFCIHSELGLKPYPLVKGYLRDQLDVPGDRLKLVVVDASGPCEPFLYAATMGAVLEAHEKRETEVVMAYRLVFDQQANAYRVQEASV